MIIFVKLAHYLVHSVLLQLQLVQHVMLAPQPLFCLTVDVFPHAHLTMLILVMSVSNVLSLVLIALVAKQVVLLVLEDITDMEINVTTRVRLEQLRTPLI